MHACAQIAGGEVDSSGSPRITLLGDASSHHWITAIRHAEFLSFTVRAPWLCIEPLTVYHYMVHREVCRCRLQSLMPEEVHDKSVIVL